MTETELCEGGSVGFGRTGTTGLVLKPQKPGGAKKGFGEVGSTRLPQAPAVAKPLLLGLRWAFCGLKWAISLEKYIRNSSLMVYMELSHRKSISDHYSTTRNPLVTIGYHQRPLGHH